MIFFSAAGSMAVARGGMVEAGVATYLHLVTSYLQVIILW